MSNDFPYSNRWLSWIKSDAGREAADPEEAAWPDVTAQEHRLLSAFRAGWDARPTVDFAPYESTVIAIDTDAGYLALHERIQEGWEPLIRWEDKHGQHMALRRLRI